MLNVWERNFVVAETVVTAFVVTETVLEAVVMRVLGLVVMVVTLLEVLGKEVWGLVVGLTVVVTFEPIKNIMSKLIFMFGTFGVAVCQQFNS